MGYTHYWYRQREIQPEIFKKIVSDFRCILPVLEDCGVPLAGGFGEGEPVITEELVSFNGRRHCGHRSVDMHIAWPAPEACGISPEAAKEAVTGTWFAGALLNTRCCDGDCSHETFYFPRVEENPHIIEKISHYRMKGSRQVPVYSECQLVGTCFSCCKTAFKPYDLAVTAFLIIAKHHLAKIIVRSDGGKPQWQDAQWLCQIELGYGLDFKLEGE
jgi:hypothetical protein